MKKEKRTNLETKRHSLSHIMAMAVLELFPGTKLGIGPAIENGFYYDFALPSEASGEGGTSTFDALPKIEAEMRELIKQNLKFTKEEISAAEAKKIFANQPYKLELIEELAKENKPITTYSTGQKEIRNSKFEIRNYFIDLCSGPHVKSTKEIAADGFKLAKIAGAYWRGDEKNPMLTRIYGVAFGSKKELDDYLKLQEEIGKRDHRKLGKDLELFSFEEVAPGAPFWHPKGMIIMKELEKLWRQLHDENGYQEISTPTMVKAQVFEKSGHLKHYRENMFRLEVESEEYFLKPMNCPESTYIYNAKTRSYKDLPLRLSEIGRLHRNELSGTLGGMFRVRQITMDDAHIYCTPEQIQKEIEGILKLVKIFYKLFNFQPTFNLATRPDEALGDPKIWQKAEKVLHHVLKSNKLKYETKPKEGAFYGPKIDIHINDALGRDWQLATIQLDFNLSERFDLSYIDPKGKKQRPVVIHRAIFGSFERFVGVLLEHSSGLLPFWLSPAQVAIIPVASRHEKYAHQVGKLLQEPGIRTEIWDKNETVSKKIREGELQKIPYLFVVGDKEIKSKTVRVRARGKGDIGEKKLASVLKMLKKEAKPKI